MGKEMRVNISDRDLPRHVRVSTGSAIVLGIQQGKLDSAPTTAYLMTYREGKCLANCGFCPQARRSRGRADMLSRVSWPVYPTEVVLDALKKVVKNMKIRRVCIQALNYSEVFSDLLALVKAIRSHAAVPVSISCQPLSRRNLRELADAGVERMGIPLDAATKQIFEEVKGRSVGGPYSWSGQFRLLTEAVGFFGKGKVSTHLIAGLGETEQEMVSVLQRCVDMTVLPALFAFTPTPGTALQSKPQPLLQSYRRIQIARHLILHGLSRYENMNFDERGCLIAFGVSEQILKEIVRTGEPFLTSGCPDCNRPYYNERPSGPIYNFPRRPMKSELSEIEDEVFGTS